MTATCDLDSADLIGCIDGELDASRKEMVVAHLRHCLICRHRIEEYAEVDRMIQSSMALQLEREARIVLKQWYAQGLRGHNSTD
jgi:anti-sigma factor RsiW